jgi:hypothetical protein
VQEYYYVSRHRSHNPKVRCLAKFKYLEKPKRPTLWNRGSILLVIQQIINFKTKYFYKISCWQFLSWNHVNNTKIYMSTAWGTRMLPFGVWEKINKTMLTSKERFWHQNTVYLWKVKILECTQEQRRRLVKGFSDIELRGTEKSGTVPSSLCSTAYVQIR